MTDIEIVTAIDQEAVKVKLSTGEYMVRPLTVRRLAKLVAMLKNVQGDPEKFKDINSPDFHKAVADMLVVMGDKMPQALGLFTGDAALEKQEDISLLDLSAIVLAAATVNKASFLLSNFQKATGIFSGKVDQK